MKYCPNCGQENSDDSKFCSKCGTRLIDSDNNSSKEVALSPVKKKVSKRTKIILIILALAIAILGGYGAYVIYQNKQFEKFVSEGNSYLDENKYQDSITSFQKAVAIKDQEPDIYSKIATAALHIRDNELAKSTYEKLFELTQDEKYKTLAFLTDYGNSPNNLTNGGNIAFQGDYSYFIDNKEGEADIWKVTPEKMELIKTIPFHQGDQPLKCLNAWGNKLFFILDDNICSLDIERKELKNFAISFVNNICIYKGVLYYSTSITPPEITPGVYKCDLNGANQETVYYGSNSYSNWNFLIYNDNLFLNQTTLQATESHLIKISLTDYSSNEIYSQSGGIIKQMCLKDNLCYFISSITNDREMTFEYSPELGSLNLDDNSVNKIDLKVPLATITIDNGKLYYISDKKLYSSELNGQNATELGTTLSSQTATDNLYSIEVFSLDFTPNNLYAITGLSYQTFQPIGNSQKFTQLVTEDDKSELVEFKFQEGNIENKDS